jgi:hypothetical protein
VLQLDYMKTSSRSTLRFSLVVLLLSSAASKIAYADGRAGRWQNNPALMSQTADGLTVTALPNGARLHCVFQKLEAEVRSEGLWLFSTASEPANDRFRVVASAVGRSPSTETTNVQHPTPDTQLAATGTVEFDGSTVQFTRPGFVEEYSVSVDGVRQDFIVEQPPLNSGPSPLNPRDGELVVRLAVDGARVEAMTQGARLVLESSGRRIAYSRLRVTDATGRELPARMEVVSVAHEVTRLQPNWEGQMQSVGMSQSLLASAATTASLALLVNDADAVYPVRIDPTFSDENWISMGPVGGAAGPVSAAAVDALGNLYIGGSFTVIGDVIANRIAIWDGSNGRLWARG